MRSSLHYRQRARSIGTLLPSLCGYLIFIFLVSACGATATPPANNGTKTPGITATATTIPTTAPQTSCPAAGTARAAVMPPLALGNRPNIVYIPEVASSNSVPAFGRLIRYDVTSSAKTEIVKLPNTGVEQAQVSADGQWMLFVANVTGQSQQQLKLQMVRLDGQDLQTLYCLPPVTKGAETGNVIYDVQWSPNQKQVVFSAVIGSSTPAISLLDLVSGKVQTELVSTDPTVYRYATNVWLDNTRVYVIGIPNSPTPQRLLSILDTTKGANQKSNDLQQVINTSQYCWDFASSPDGTKLFTSQCTVPNPTDQGLPVQKGPSSISMQSATGGQQQIIYSTSTFALRSIRAASSTTLLLVIQNSGTNADTSRNGLWKINTDGSGLTRLTTESADKASYLDGFEPWSNVSRDGGMFALRSSSLNPKSGSTSLFFGSMSGGTPTMFADGGAIVGWTMM